MESGSNVHRIKLKQLNEEFIQRLKSQSVGGNADVVIHIHPKPEGDLLTENEFWDLIALLDWEEEDDDHIIAPVINALSFFSIPKILQFEDFLSEKLYLLDTKAHAEQIGENAFQENEPFSVDSFLYARCCVIANGRDFFEMVLNNPFEMPKNLTFEPLLYLAQKAFLLKTGEQLEYMPVYNFETFSNKSGWA